MEPTQPQFSGDPAHLQVIIEAAEHQDASIWNTWRNDAKVERPNLRGANLAQVVLHGVNLQFADLTGACLQNATITASLDYAVFNEANLRGAHMWLCRFEETQLVQADCRECEFRSSRIVASNFSHAQLQKADFERCYLEDTFFDWADLSNASFYQADLWMAFLKFAKLHRANLRGANLHGAELIECDLRRTVFVDSDVREATIRDCAVYAVSAWGLKRDESTFQRNLRVSNDDEVPLFVDDIEVAQFIYLLLNNEKIRHIIDTITSKVVLILGRFTPERKAILDALREELRRRDYVPVLFDFDPPKSKDVTGTAETLARMARFVIADFTDPSSIPHELATIVPLLRTTPVLPLKLAGAGGYSMFSNLQRYPWVLKTHEYQDSQSLIAALPAIIAPADTLANELRSRE